MKVKAKLLGFYGNARKRVGEIFIIKDETHFSEKWMEKVDGDIAVGKRKKSKVKEDLSVEPVTADQDVI